jgi:Protein of unknown function (DUF3828)
MSIYRFSATVLFAASIYAGLSSAQPNDSPRNFLASIYRNYENGGNGIGIGNGSASRYFTSSLLALVRADATAAGPGNVGAIDADPVCACQDWDGIWDLDINVRTRTPGFAEADVSFSLSPPQRRLGSDSRRLSIKLISEHGGWRIDDIIDRTDPKNPFALRKALIEDIELNRRATAHPGH